MDSKNLVNRRPEASSDADAIDQQLIARIIERDREAFRDLYLDYHTRLARFLMRLTRNRADVEEVVNDTLYVVWAKTSSFRQASRVSTWIFGIAYRRSRKVLRKSLRYERTILREQAEANVVPSYADASANEEQQALKHALAQLPVEQRMVMELAYFLGYSCVEVSEIMDVPVNTVKSRMWHARKKLQSLLTREDLSRSPTVCPAAV